METLAMAASSGSVSPEIQAAVRAHTWLNVVYVCTVVIVAILTVLVWKSGNRLQDAIRKDAEDRKAANAMKAADALAQLTVETEKAREEIAKAQAEAAEATLKAEEERHRRIKLEAALAPRTIAAPGRSRKELKLFAGTKALITYVEDSEARDLAQQVYVMLHNAEWNVLSMVPDSPRVAAQGVQVRTRAPKTLNPLLDDAAEILYFQLRDDNIDASLHTGVGWQGFRADFPDDAVLIHIGRKPSSAVVTPVNTDLLDESRSPHEGTRTGAGSVPRSTRVKDDSGRTGVASLPPP
jgi:hypothetical protein